MQMQPTQKHRKVAGLGRTRPRGVMPIGIFFVFGATMAAYAAITLLKPGTLLDRLWAMNPRAHAELTVYGRIAGIPFVIVSGTLAFVSGGLVPASLLGMAARRVHDSHQRAWGCDQLRHRRAMERCHRCNDRDGPVGIHDEQRSEKLLWVTPRSYRN